MATTFQIAYGDVVVNGFTGRPNLIGNAIGVDDPGTAKTKAVQDIGGGLSIDRVVSGAGAGLAELVGLMDQLGPGSTATIVGQRIRDMFNAMVVLQKNRPGIRPNDEMFKKITLLQVVPKVGDPTSFTFRLDILTVAGTQVTLSGTISAT